MITIIRSGTHFSIGSKHTFEALDILSHIKSGLVSRRGRVKLLKYISSTYHNTKGKLFRMLKYHWMYNLILTFSTGNTQAMYFYEFYFDTTSKRIILFDWSNKSLSVDAVISIHPSIENAIKFYNFIISRIGKAITEKRIMKFLKTIDSDDSIIKVKTNKDYLYSYTANHLFGPTIIRKCWNGSYLSVWFGNGKHTDEAYIEVDVTILPKQLAERLNAPSQLIFNGDIVTAIYSPRIVYPLATH